MSLVSYMEQLRLTRGRDDAVKVIGPRTNLIRILLNLPSHKRENIQQELFKSYLGRAYGATNWTKIIPAWTEPEKITLNGAFAHAYPHLSQLELDIGFMTHLPEFMKFAEKHDVKDKDFVHVREEFKDYLGTKTVYRGMVISEQEVEAIQKKGVESFIHQGAYSHSSKIKYFEAHVLSTFADYLFEAHFHRGLYNFSPLVSVSEYAPLAIAVGRHFGRRRINNEEGSLYLVEANVPEIDLVYYTEHAVKQPSEFQRGSGKVAVHVDGTKYVYNWDRKVESFLLQKIDADEIVSITKPKLESTSWHGRILGPQ